MSGAVVGRINDNNWLYFLTSILALLEYEFKANSFTSSCSWYHTKPNLFLEMKKKLYFWFSLAASTFWWPVLYPYSVLHLINDKCLLLQFSLHFTHLNTFSSAIFFKFILLKNKNKKQTCHQNIVKFNTFFYKIQFIGRKHKD